MYLVEDRSLRTIHLVFTWEDPRKDGYSGAIIEDVSLDYDMEEVHRWPNGQATSEPCVGVSLHDPKHYKVFRNAEERRKLEYTSVEGIAVVFGSWSDYLRLRLDPPDPAWSDEQSWYEYLDKLDERSRERRRTAPPDRAPAGKGRDEVAAWLAKRHFVADDSIREIWYLPKQAPADEIRLLELSDRLVAGESSVAPVDFGLDVEGIPFRLFVADVSSDQLETIKQDPSPLPSGWQIAGSTIWKRRRA